MAVDDETAREGGRGDYDGELVEWGDTPVWSRSSAAVLDALEVESETGLTEREARERRDEVGLNALRESESESVWSVFVDQFKSIIVGLLVAATILAFLFGEYVEMFAIAGVVVINAAIGFATELRAVRSMEALQEMVKVPARVRRDGDVREVTARELVPGDIVVLEAGNMVGADMRLVDSSQMEIDESVLTGESVPVEKHTEPLDADKVLADRENMVHRGTAVTRGSGLGVVVGTGMQTEVGRISELVERAAERETPLEHRLDELGRKLVWVCLGLAALIAAIGLIQGKELFVVVETAIALAVATIPEGLPIVATIALARGMWRMADRNALIRNLAVVETLGSANTILTDKTGTLTENRMTVAEYRHAERTIEVETPDESSDRVQFEVDGEVVELEDDPILQRALEIGLFCNNEPVQTDPSGAAERVGEPMEVALRKVASEAGLAPAEKLERHPRVGEEPFEADTAMMATYHEYGDQVRVAVKGAPESVLAASTRRWTSEGTEPFDDELRERWREANHEMAESGLRVLALAEKTVEESDAPPYEDLEFVGLVGMIDPARGDVRRALDACRSAGIEVVMVTGDQPGTALYIARELDMLESDEEGALHGKELADVDDASEARADEIAATRVFARVTPEQKLDLVELHQERGAVVAMTGDGVNDAPALVQADIGIAMGERGTQVAQEAADMVLGDDRFETIVAAIEQGRIIFENIRKFALYLLSCNVSEILIVSIAALAFPNAPLPLTALQILYLNLVTDVFPALALGLGEGDEHMMDRPPRDPEEPILGGPQWTKIAVFGGIITAVVLVTYFVALFELGYEGPRAVTVSFLTLALAQLWHVFNMRVDGASRWNNDVTRNPFVWGALALCTLLMLIVVYVPPLAMAVNVVRPGLEGWMIALVASFVPPLVGLVRR